jgi:hypothetical protein
MNKLNFEVSVSLKEFMEDYCWCDLCNSWQEGYCICYAR